MATIGDQMGRLGYGLMIVCTLAMTGIVVRREFLVEKPSEPGTLPTKKVSNWGELSSVGHRAGPQDAEVTVVQFSDFECPACKEWNQRILPSFRVRFPTVAFLYRHWPLNGHRFAYPAARAAECAAAQGKFNEFHDLLFALQDSLGIKPFTEFAKQSGVPDAAAFARCNADTARVAAIEADLAAVRGIGGRGTPTFVIDGILFPAGLDSAILDSIVRKSVNKLR